MEINSEYFEFSDAWLLTSLFMYDENLKQINLTNIIAYGDALNHSIFTLEELHTGFNKLYVVDLIEIKNDSIKLTQTGLEIKEKVFNDSAGLFERIDNTLKRIRKIARTKILNASPNITFEFLNELEFESAYAYYKNE